MDLWMRDQERVSWYSEDFMVGRSDWSGTIHMLFALEYDWIVSKWYDSSQLYYQPRYAAR